MFFATIFYQNKSKNGVFLLMKRGYDINHIRYVEVGNILDLSSTIGVIGCD